jgi:hypothetical protein
MKRILVALTFLMLSSSVMAIDVWKSSTTATNDGVYDMLCPKRAVFHGVCTDFGVAASSVTIFNSSFTVTGVKQIGPISTLVADQCKYYDAEMPNGLGYQKTNVAGITILYSCYGY